MSFRRSSARLLALVTLAIASLSLFASPAWASHITLPAKMGAMGDSLSTGWGASGAPADDFGNSFATGNNPRWYSHVERLRGMRPGVDSQNVARAGARLETVIRQDMNGVPLPGNQVVQLDEDVEYVTITLGSSDLCRPSKPTGLPITRRRALELMRQLQARLGTADILVVPMPNWVGIRRSLQGDRQMKQRWNQSDICPRIFGSRVTNQQLDQWLGYIRAFNQHMASACAQFDSPSFRCFYAARVFGIKWTKADLSTWDGFHPSARGQAKLSKVSWGASPYGLGKFGLRYGQQPSLNKSTKTLSLDLHTAPNADIAVTVQTLRGRVIGSRSFTADGNGDMQGSLQVPGYRGQSNLKLVFRVHINDQTAKFTRNLAV